MAKGWALSTGNLPLGGLPSNSVDLITGHPDMTSAVDLGRKPLIQQIGDVVSNFIPKKINVPQHVSDPNSGGTLAEVRDWKPYLEKRFKGLLDITYLQRQPIEQVHCLPMSKIAAPPGLSAERVMTED